VDRTVLDSAAEHQKLAFIFVVFHSEGNWRLEVN
jgi:hypothetical protein